MNIRLFRICSVPIRISSPQLHVSVVEEQVELLGGGLRTLCIKISYSEPTQAESREGSSRRRELSGDVILDSGALADNSGALAVKSGALADDSNLIRCQVLR